MIHTVKVFSLVSEAEVDVFLELLCFFCDPTDVGNLISGTSAFSKSSLYIWKFLVHVLLKPSLDDFEHYLASMWNECNCVVVWTFFGIACLWDWNENWSFPVLWPLLSFPNLQTNKTFFQIWGSTRPFITNTQKDVLFIIGDWNAKGGSHETPGVTGKFGLGIQNEAGQRLIEFCQENALAIANTLFQQHKRRLYTWTSPDGQHRNQIDSILCSQR